MCGLGLLLFVSWSVCGSLLAEPENNTSTLSITSLISQTTEASSPISERSTTPSPTSKFIQTTTSPWLNSKECPRELIVCGALIIACAFFLMTTFLLTCKVCRLSRRIRMLSRIAQPNGNSDFLEPKKDKSKSEGKDKETTVLMSYVTQADQEPDTGATEEDERKSEEKNESGSPTGEEALATAASSTFSQPQEEAAGSETTPAAAAVTSSSEGTEEPHNQP